jgi:demethylsterigmatocystin 6-O-methyltransferase
VLVLEKTRAAMAADSRLVVDDIVVPDVGACTAACQLDFIMMASIAGKKRTRAQWYDLLGKAGFRIVDVRKYSEPMGDSLIVAERADAD